VKSFLRDFAEMLRAVIVGLILLYAAVLPLWALVMFARNFASTVEFVIESVMSILENVPYLLQM